MADPTPTPAPSGRNARRRAHTERTIEEAYEAGLRDGRAETAEQVPAPADETLRENVAEAIDAQIPHAATAPATTAYVILTDVMKAVAPALDARWEQGRKHGLRQAWAPQRGRERQLEEEIESMATIAEANSAAWQLKCERVHELEVENARLRLAWQSARRRARQQRDALREALAADRDQVRRTRDRYRADRDTARRENADLRAQLDIEQHNHVSERNLRQAAYAEITDLRAQLAATTNPARAEARLAADTRPDSTPSPEAVEVHLEAVDDLGQTASLGYTVRATATVKQQDGHDVTVLTVPPGRWLLSVAPYGRGRPRTITHIRISAPAGELALVPLREPRRFARPGDVEVTGLRVEIPARLAADTHPGTEGSAR